MKKKEIKIFISVTAGGHLTEALELFEGLDNTKLIIASDTSYRLQSNGNKTYVYKAIKNPKLRFFVAFLKALWIIIKERPDWTISTGAEYGVLAIVAAKMLFCKTIFIETVTRYKGATKSARICYHIVTHFFVQQEEGLKLFGNKARYIGGLF